MRKILFFVLGCSIAFAAYGQRTIGNYSANPYDPNSTANPYGAGNPYDANSIRNPYGTYGNPYSPNSVTNPYATNAPKCTTAKVITVGG